MEASSRYPSVFVVDGPARDLPFVPPVPRSQKPRRHCQLLLGFLVLMALAGLAVQAYFLICFRKELDKATAQSLFLQAKKPQAPQLEETTTESSWDCSLLIVRPQVSQDLQGFAPNELTEAAAEASHDRLIQDPKPPPEKPGAHLTGASFTTTGNDTLQWEHRHGAAFLQEMDYKAGSLVCQRPGRYYIYSKVFLEHASCSDVREKSRLVTHSIRKRTPRYRGEIVLLTSIIPYCGTQTWRHNSFLGGMVQLQEKEEIYVKVSEMQLVRVKDGTRSYFGTFMI